MFYDAAFFPDPKGAILVSKMKNLVSLFFLPLTHILKLPLPLDEKKNRLKECPNDSTGSKKYSLIKDLFVRRAAYL